MRKTRNPAIAESATFVAPTAAQRIKVGDLIWVKETFATDPLIDNGVRYYATDHVHELRKKRGGMMMPKWASRLTLVVTGVKVERLQDISEADAVDEGFTWDAFKKGLVPTAPNPRASYCLYYEKIHGKGAWDANPEVVAITFTVHKANIDRFDQPPVAQRMERRASNAKAAGSSPAGRAT